MRHFSPKTGKGKERLILAAYILALKHISRIFGHCNYSALPFCPVCGCGISFCSVLKCGFENEKQEVLGRSNVRKFYSRALEQGFLPGSQTSLSPLFSLFLHFSPPSYYGWNWNSCCFAGCAEKWREQELDVLNPTNACAVRQWYSLTTLTSRTYLPLKAQT